MACFWCEDEELAIDSLNYLKKPPQTQEPEKLRKLLHDFFFCDDCITAYHRLKNEKIKDQSSIDV